MNLIIGIILGFLIIFNWGSIKDYMDHKFSNPTTESSEQHQNKDSSSNAGYKDQKKSGSKENKSNEKDDDFFNKFK
jgi:predicted negative regulator of RcsB-dependent stress response